MNQMKTQRGNLWRLGAVCLLLSGAIPAIAQRLTWLGTGNQPISRAQDVADNGTVVGYLEGTTGFSPYTAFVWTRERGLEPIGGSSATTASIARTISQDGTTVLLQTGRYLQQQLPYLWRRNTGAQLVNFPPGVPWALGAQMSRDGSTVVGMLQTPRGTWRAFRWKNGVAQLLDTTNQNDWSGWAACVSADGEIVAGNAQRANSGEVYLFRWTADNGWEDLGNIPLGGWIIPYAMSADGETTVGAVDTPNFGRQPFYWKRETGIQLIPTPPGAQGAAYSVSSDGTVIVGAVFLSDSSAFAFLWTEAAGLQNLNQQYASLLEDGSTLLTCDAISPNGRYLAGAGYNASTGRYEAYLLDTQAPPPPQGDVDGDGCVNDADLLTVLFNYGDFGTGDVNRDGIVDDADLMIVLLNFGNGCSD